MMRSLLGNTFKTALAFSILMTISSCKLQVSPKKSSNEDKSLKFSDGGSSDNSSDIDSPELVNDPYEGLSVNGAYDKLMRDKCLTCHAPGKSAYFLDFQKSSEEIIAAGLITPQNPFDSKMYYRLQDVKLGKGNENMPLGDSLSSDERAIVFRYILSIPVAEPEEEEEEVVDDGGNTPPPPPPVMEEEEEEVVDDGGNTPPPPPVQTRSKVVLVYLNNQERIELSPAAPVVEIDASRGFSIIVEPLAPDTSRVNFDFGRGLTQSEGIAPYAACGDNTGTDYNNCVSQKPFPYDVELSLSIELLKDSAVIESLNDIKVMLRDSVTTLPPSTVTFAQAKAVIDNYCLSCHKAGESAANINFDLDTEEEYFNTTWFRPGDITSPAIVRTKGSGYPSTISNMPFGRDIPVSDFETLRDWIVSKEPSSTGNNEVQDPLEQFSCSDENNASISDLKRLTKLQLKNTLVDLFGESIFTQASSKFNLLPSDGDSTSFKSFRSDFTNYHASTLFDIADKISEGVYSDINKRKLIFGDCSASDSPAINCIDTYLSGYATKILRKPLTTTEKDAAKVVYGYGTTAKEKFKAVLTYHLISPDFLIQMETGSQNVDSESFEVTSYELAQRLSYMITNSTPDDGLLAKAANGTLKNASTLNSEVRRLLNTARAKEKFKKLSSFYLQNNEDATTPASSLSSDFLDGINPQNLISESISELEKFTEYVIWGGKNFKDLLNSKASFASDPSLASVYGHGPVSGNTPAQFSGERKGILGRIPFLFRIGHRTPTIHRGVLLRNNILCSDIPEPSADILDQRDDAPLTLAQREFMTTREITHYVTKGTACISCHKFINPAGFAFENFDPLGRERTRENIYSVQNEFIRALDVSNRTEFPLWGVEKIDVSGQAELLDFLSTSNKVTACFAKKVSEFAVEKSLSDKDSCKVDRLYKELKSSNGSIFESLVKLYTSNSIKLRRMK